MLIPTPRLLILAGVFIVLSLVVALLPALLIVYVVLLIISLLMISIDALQLLRCPAPEVTRTLSGSLPVGLLHTVNLHIANITTQPQKVAFHDHYPAGLQVFNAQQHMTLQEKQWLLTQYQIKPIQRGDLHFKRVELRLYSRIGFWCARRFAGSEQVVHVYPNFTALTQLALLATDNRLSQIGILQRRRRGEGLDFRQLREYREGDTPRQIDWKATARHRRVISREYQDERDQQIVLLVDCGRRMQAKDGDLSHFDQVLNAALLLSFVALRQGDAVGLQTMSGVDRWLAPKKSQAMINRLLEHTYNLEPTFATSDYYSAAVSLMTRLRKRALVVVLSNLRDEDDSTLTPALTLLQTRHLVLFASLKERVLSDSLQEPIDTLDDALTHAASAEYLQRRHQIFQQLNHRGILSLDIEPDRLPMALVNRYLDVKRSGRL